MQDSLLKRNGMPKIAAVLGATGSVGRQALDVARHAEIKIDLFFKIIQAMLRVKGHKNHGLILLLNHLETRSQSAPPRRISE